MKKASKWLGPLLVLLFVVPILFPGQGFAANGDVQAIELEDAENILLWVEDQEQLKLLATVEGSTAKMDVTKDATWTSSNSKAIKVDKGLLTALSKGEATITAKYKGYTATVKVNAEYEFKELQLSQTGTVEYKLGTKNNNLTAFAIEEDDTENDVTDLAQWTSSNTSVLTVAEGKLSLVGTGTATITAKHRGLSASVQVRVSSPYSKLEIDAPKEMEVLVGEENIELQAIATFENGTQENVAKDAEWKTSNASIVTVTEGRITPLASGKATISVQYLGVAAQISVVVRTPYEVLLLSPSNDWTLFINEAPVQLQAYVMNEAVNRKDVTSEATWTSSNTHAVTVQNGMISPKAVGTATIKVAYRGLSKEIKITVQPTITKIEAEKDHFDLFKGEVVSAPKIHAYTLDEKKLDFSKEIEWTSSDDKIARVENGKITAYEAGSVQLTAKIRNFTQTIHVRIEEKVLLLLPAQESISMITGTEHALPVVWAVRENGIEEDVTDKIQWSLSGSSAVLVDNNIKSYVKGNLRLTGTYLNQSIRIPVTIEQEIISVLVEPNEIELGLKKSKAIKVTGFYANGSKVNLSSKIEWVSSNPSVASIKNRSVRGETEGNVVLTGSYQGHELEVKVRVIPKLKKLEAAEKKVQLAIGQTFQASVTALYDTGDTQVVTQQVAWTSNKANVARVVDGKIEAVGKGTATIKATLDNKSVSIRVTVK